MGKSNERLARCNCWLQKPTTERPATDDDFGRVLDIAGGDVYRPIYLAVLDKMGDLSKNLSRHEFACKCECGFDTVDAETIKVIQDVCENFECSVTITSGCRCPAHNRKVGGTKNSQHLLARAADCVFILDGNPIEPTEIHYYLVSEHEGYGFGLYETFNHIDTRSGKPARWGA